MGSFIYALVDPIEPGHVRYVGMATQAIRPYQHAMVACRPSTKPSHLINWVRSIQALHREPQVLVLETCDVSRQLLGFVEKCYIKSLREIGHRLTNVAEGGDGGATRLGYRNTEEQKAAVRNAMLGRPKSVEHRANLSAARKGRPGHMQSPEEIAKRNASIAASIAYKEAMKSPVRSERIAAGQRGRKHSAEEVATNQAACAAARERIRSENGGRFRTVESCLRASRSISAAYAARSPKQKRAQVEKRRATIAAKKVRGN